jgi:hypothetical protein
MTNKCGLLQMEPDKRQPKLKHHGLGLAQMNFINVGTSGSRRCFWYASTVDTIVTVSEYLRKISHLATFVGVGV